MKTLDRYILRQFLINLLVLGIVLMGLFMVIDLIVNVDEFLEGGDIHSQQVAAEQAAERFEIDLIFAERMARERWSVERIAQSLDIGPAQAASVHDALQPGWPRYVRSTLFKIFDYYGPVVLLLFVYFSGVLTLGALGFTFTAMVRNRELTAIVASGVSMYRIAAPVLIVGIAVNALALPIQEFLIPPLAPKLARGPSDVSRDTVESFPVYLAADMTNNILLSAADFDAGEKQMRNVTIIERDDTGVAQRRVTASLARWDEQQQGWTFAEGGGYAISLKQQDLESLGSIDPDYLTFYATELSPTVILARQAAIYSRLLPIRQLQQMQANEAIDASQRGRVTQVIWSRFTMLIVNALVLVMALRFFLLRAPANLLWQSIKACIMCLGAWAGSLVALQMPSVWFNPVAAAWIPVILLLPFVTWHLSRLET